MIAVAVSAPTSPLVMSAMMMEMHVLTSVLPMSSVQSSRLPDSRRGIIVFACLRSSSSPPSAITCSSVVSRPMSPRVRPENMPESRMSTTITTHMYHSMLGAFLRP